MFFLFGLLAIAAAVWLWGSAFQKGREYREWLNQDPVPENEAFFAKLGQDLQAFFSGLSTFSGTLALRLLGVQETEPAKAGSQPTLQPGSTTTTVAPSATKQPEKLANY